MSDLQTFYDLNPVGVFDTNQWTLHDPEVNAQFRAQAIYTPLIDWDASPQDTGAVTTIEHELLEGDVDSNPIPLSANYIEAHGLDSRFRKFSVERHGDKVQVHRSSNYFNMWKMSGGRDWRPLLRGALGWNVVTKFEMLARNVWFKGPRMYWTYAGGKTSFGTLTGADKFDIAIVNAWNLRLGQTGSPVIPGDAAAAKLATVPPGAVYDFMQALAGASASEASMWRDATLYQQRLNYELGAYKGVRFQQVPSNKFGINPNILYNAGAIAKQYAVTAPIRLGDGAPDPEVTPVDGVWYVGQKGAAHHVQLENFEAGDFAVNDVVTLHVKRTANYGVTGGVDPFDGRTIVRRVVAADDGTNQLSFDRPVMFNYTAPFAAKSVTGNADVTAYAYVTRGINVGFSLVLGSRGGVLGKVLKPIEFYEPVPVDDFNSVYRYSWDALIGHNIAEPNLFELYFYAVSIPKPGGVG